MPSKLILLIVLVLAGYVLYQNHITERAFNERIKNHLKGLSQDNLCERLLINGWEEKESLDKYNCHVDGCFAVYDDDGAVRYFHKGAINKALGEE